MWVLIRYFISCLLQYFRVKDALSPEMKKRKPSKVLNALSLEKISEEMETSTDDAFIAGTFIEEEKTDANEITDHGEDGSEATCREMSVVKTHRTVEEDSQDNTEREKKQEWGRGGNSQNVGENLELKNAIASEESGNSEMLATRPSEGDGDRKRLRVEESNVRGQTIEEEKVPPKKRQKLSGK